MSPQWIQIQTDRAYQVPLKLFQTQRPQRDLSIVVLPALGVSASFYDPFAQALNEQGYNVVVVEQRGHGKSELRPSRSENFGFADILQEDIPAALDYACQHLPASRRVLIGHSLGGHLGAMACGLYPQLIDGLVLSACGSPWVRAYRGKTRLQIHLLQALVRLSGPLFGYYPGDRIGFGGREARQLMADWLHLARDNRYVATGLEQDLDIAVSQYTGPVLSLGHNDDELAPPRARQAVTDKFSQAQVSEALINRQQLGRKADHYAWVRQGQVAAAQIQQWSLQVQEQPVRAA